MKDSDDGLTGRAISMWLLLSLACTTIPLQAGSQIAITPPSVTLKPLATCEFKAEVAGADKLVEWSVKEPGGGSFIGSDIGSPVTYSAPLRAGTFHVVASLRRNPSVRAVATLTIVGPVDVRIVPATATLGVGGSVDFYAEIRGGMAGLSWRVQEDDGGDVESFSDPSDPQFRTVRYQAPMKAGTYHVVARIPQSGPPVQGVAAVTVVPPKVSIEPAQATMKPYETKQFQAVLPDNVSPALVIWRVQERESGGTASNGFFMAPGEPGIYHLLAQIEFSNPPSNQAVAIVTVEGEGPDPGPQEGESSDPTEAQSTAASSLPEGNRRAIEVLEPIAEAMQGKQGEVLILFWDWKGGGVFGDQPSVGHVASAVKSSDRWVIVHSQFPHDSGGKSRPVGPNITIAKPNVLFLAEGGRKPNSAYLVTVPNMGGFANYLMLDLAKPHWTFDPNLVSHSTNCTYGAIHGLRAGGVPLSSMWANQTLIIPGTPYLPRDLRVALKLDASFNVIHDYKIHRKNELIEVFQWEEPKND